MNLQNTIPNHNHAKFIVIEGIDGSGKTTQIELLKQSLSSDNIIFTREASDGPIGKLLRDQYLNKHRKCDEHIINILYAADRLDHITNSENGLIQYISSGKSIICDRYALSALAYDNYIYANNPTKLLNEIRKTINLNYKSFELLQPDLTIYLQLDPEVALKRMMDNRDDLSIYETIDKLQNISNAYTAAMELLYMEYNNEFMVIDASNDIMTIHDMIKSKIINVLNIQY